MEMWKKNIRDLDPMIKMDVFFGYFPILESELVDSPKKSP